jgi:heme/copper-type cytochrome/quinol oxidase subunit 2
MSRSTKGNFTEDGFPAYPPDFLSTEHGKSGSGISTTIAVTVTWPLNVTEDGSLTNPPGLAPLELDKSSNGISTIALIAMSVLVVAAFLFLNFQSLAYMCFRCRRRDQDQASSQQLPLQSLHWGRTSERQ